MIQNRFGYTLYDPLLIFDGATREIELAATNMSDLFSFLSTASNLSFSQVIEVCKSEFKKARDGESLKEARLRIEQILRNQILAGDSRMRLSTAFDERADKIGYQLALHINQLLESPTISVADIGCGDGRVSSTLKNSLSGSIDEFLIADVLDYRLPIVKTQDYTWNQLKKGYRNIGLDESDKYDLVLLSTVLHHTDNPESVINACYRSLKAGGLIVIVESCIGVNEQMASNFRNLDGNNIIEISDTAKQYVQLGADGQMLYGSFIDWFYNRILNMNINVPFNFNNPVNWNTLVEDFPGMKVERVFLEGFDQITVPEFHTIHFFKRTR